MGLLTWAGLVLLSLLLPYGDTTRNALWLVGASLPLFAVSSASQTLFQAGERMELVMGVEIFINTLILAHPNRPENWPLLLGLPLLFLAGVPLLVRFQERHPVLRFVRARLGD